MNTAYASRTIREIHAEKKAALEAMKARGIRDEITAMEWPTGTIEISGQTVNGKVGPKWTQKTVADWARANFGSGKLRIVEIFNIEGRKVTRYEVV
jgi:hypothetical protein